MKLTLLSELAVRLERAEGPFAIYGQSPELDYSPFHMLAGALAAPIRWSDMAAEGFGGYFFAVSENRKLKASTVTRLRERFGPALVGQIRSS